MRKLFSQIAVLAALVAAAPSALATVSVGWISPPNGSIYPVGTTVAPVGQASAFGSVGGTGLDLALVIDISGSMAGAGITSAKNAATALVNALPVNTTAVTVIGFNSVANTYAVLTQLNPNKASVLSAINGLAAGGGTEIGSGIVKATSELTGANHTAGRSQQMVVLSDGFSGNSPNIKTSANNAIAAGVDAIHAVGVPGHNVAQMQSIVSGTDNIYNNADDVGVYSASDLTGLINLFNGTSGNLVGLSKVVLTEPDGTVHDPYPIDGLGNFTAPNWNIQAGGQTWVATAYDTAGNSASASLTLYGQRTTGVPDAGSSLMLLGAGLMGLVGMARTTRK